jgi:hypothetical protein
MVVEGEPARTTTRVTLGVVACVFDCFGVLLRVPRRDRHEDVLVDEHDRRFRQSPVVFTVDLVDGEPQVTFEKLLTGGVPQSGSVSGLDSWLCGA